ncbi:MAG: heparan-alpha-glucosaminide N-acetyltransferase domain-containing protein [Candidatus Helarchaeota archaeon]
MMDEKQKIPRIFSVDIYRGYLIALMVIHHYGEWVYHPLNGNILLTLLDYLFIQLGLWPVFNPIAIHQNIALKIQYIFSYLGTYPFMIIVGISLVLSTEIRRGKGYSDSDITKHEMKRVLWILFFHFLLGQIVLGPGTLWWSGVLSIIALNILVGYFFQKFSKKINAIIAILIFTLSPLIKDILNIPAVGYYTDPDPGILGALRFISYNTLAQLIPVLSFTLLGLIIGRYIVDFYRNGKMHNLTYILLIAGGAFWIMGASMDPFAPYYGYMYILVPLQMYEMLYALGVFCISFGILFWITDVKKKHWRIFEFFRLCGTTTLTLYFFHHFLGLNYIMYYNHPLANSLSTFTYFEIWVALWSFLWIYLSLWKRKKFKYSLEYFIRKYS